MNIKYLKFVSTLLYTDMNINIVLVLNQKLWYGGDVRCMEVEERLNQF